MLTQCTSSITTRPTPIERERLDEGGAAKPLRRRVEEARAPGGDVARCGRPPRPASSDELTNVAVAAISAGSLSTWSFISAISGERTSVGSGRSIAASW